ncbi:uncharacterized protein LACBIDRAFT_324769 [Laccaria bicolor S238N-H82]|uniref:Predicted protein n=1 Tax=Laccaria bicolor (strain S238N-H82 / ATCC MYA-4686) TaxID=486041 RepID=B0D2Z7_LACBS|nr:uncharacterized protein LACBIDRAFT_324769 [Laccaria bicolor S238N-H82]EDR11184.1 predicted protein [Laccaria bicolor S238N-H82]|eukprot:XP_001878485.1 predicted protein [Laccaria bicolor S238N-H82]
MPQSPREQKLLELLNLYIGEWKMPPAPANHFHFLRVSMGKKNPSDFGRWYFYWDLLDKQCHTYNGVSQCQNYKNLMSTELTDDERKLIRHELNTWDAKKSKSKKINCKIIDMIKGEIRNIPSSSQAVPDYDSDSEVEIINFQSVPSSSQTLLDRELTISNSDVEEIPKAHDGIDVLLILYVAANDAHFRWYSPLHDGAFSPFSDFALREALGFPDNRYAIYDTYLKEFVHLPSYCSFQVQAGEFFILRQLDLTDKDCPDVTNFIHKSDKFSSSRLTAGAASQDLKGKCKAQDEQDDIVKESKRMKRDCVLMGGPLGSSFILEIFIGYAPSPFPATCPLIDHTSWGQDPRTTNEHVSHGPLIKLQGMKPSSLPFHHVVKGDFASNYKKLAHQLEQGHFDGLSDPLALTYRQPSASNCYLLSHNPPCPYASLKNATHPTSMPSTMPLNFGDSTLELDDMPELEEVLGLEVMAMAVALPIMPHQSSLGTTDNSRVGNALIDQHAAKSRKKNRAPFPWSEEQRAWMKGHVDPYLELDPKKCDMWSKQKVEDLVNKWRFANAGDARQCFIKYLQNALARSRTSQKQPPIIKFPRKRAENAADLWAKAPENKILLDTAVAEKRGDASTKNNVGIRSTLKAAMFKALSSKEQEQWEKKASELKEVSAEDKVESIWENQEIMADTLVATLEGSIGMGKNQVGDATYHVQMVYLDKEGNVQSTSICCGIMLDDKAFKDVEPETYTSLSKAWINFLRKRPHARPNNEFAITLAKDSTGNPILPQYDDSWVQSHCAEVLGHYLEGVWKSTGLTEAIPWSLLREDPSRWIVDPAAVPKTPIDDPCVIKGTTIFKLYDELWRHRAQPGLQHQKFCPNPAFPKRVDPKPAFYTDVIDLNPAFHSKAINPNSVFHSEVIDPNPVFNSEGLNPKPAFHINEPSPFHYKGSDPTPTFHSGGVDPTCTFSGGSTPAPLSQHIDDATPEFYSESANVHS